MVVGIALLVGIAGVAAAPVALADSQTNETATETATETTATETAEECEVGPNDPNLRQAGLHTTDSVIDVGSPGEISGQFRLSSASECAVMVSVTLNAPNGMYFEGGQNIEGSTSGLAQGEFIVDSGDPQEVRATVYSEIDGEQLVTADVEYWPVGHPDELQTQTFRMSMDVQEPNGDGSGEGTTGGSVPDIPTEWLLIGLVGVSLVGLIAIGYKGAKAEVKNKFIKR